MELSNMKKLIILILTATALAQAPAPKTGKDADVQLQALRNQKETLREKLMKNPDYVKFIELQDQIEQMQIRANVLHMQDAEQESLARYKAKQAQPK
jgi:TolA-binding protein